MAVFDKSTGAFRQKIETPVRLQLAGGAPQEAWAFTAVGERITDLLNDPRAFIPVRTGRGVMIVAKTQIASIIERETDEDAGNDAGEAEENEAKTRAKSFDPYAALRVSQDAGLEEIRAAYKARIKAVHPDTLASLGLDDDLKKAALLATQKVNYAYQKIMRDRTGVDGDEDAACAAG